MYTVESMQPVYACFMHCYFRFHALYVTMYVTGKASSVPFEVGMHCFQPSVMMMLVVLVLCVVQRPHILRK